MVLVTHGQVGSGALLCALQAGSRVSQAVGRSQEEEGPQSGLGLTYVLRSPHVDVTETLLTVTRVCQDMDVTETLLAVTRVCQDALERRCWPVWRGAERARRGT